MLNHSSLQKIAKHSLRFGFGLLLCANYSCSSTNSVVQKDPFNRGAQGPAPGSSAEATQGNHGLLEKSRPLDQPLAATMPQSHQSFAEAGYQQQPNTEWAALPEKRIGVAPPQMRQPTGLQTAMLPPGGYQQPLGKSQPWTKPMARLTAAPKQNAVMPVSHEVQQQAPCCDSESCNIAPDFPKQAKANSDPKPASQSNQIKPNQIKQLSFEEFINEESNKKPASKIQQTSHAKNPAFKQANFTPASPRVALQQVSAPTYPGCTIPAPGAACQNCDPAFYPDEYLCDGGDRNLPVHYSPGFRQGLDTQDTITEYKDDQGKHHVKKSNQACIYAPRFAAVTTTSGISQNTSVNRALGAYETVNGLAINTRIKPGTEQQTDRIKSARVRTGLSGLESEDITMGVNQATTLEKHSKLINTNTDYAFSGQDQFDRWQAPTALDGIQAAAVWTRKLSPVIVASSSAGTELYSSFKPEQMIGLEEKYKAKGELYIDKSADKADAKPGDIITFTIRYRNTGDRALSNVMIIDNLTPRLEFIEGSGTSDRDGKLVVEDNQEGSLILKWELKDEVKGKTAGTVSFQARVR